jgi:WD40 repeat protein
MFTHKLYLAALLFVGGTVAFTQEPVYYWQTASHPMAFDISADGRYAAVAERDSLIELFDLQSKQRVWINDDHTREQVVFKERAEAEYMQVVRSAIARRRRHPDQALHLPVVSQVAITRVRFLPGDQQLVTGAWDTTIRCFSAATGEQLWKLNKAINPWDTYSDKPQVKDLQVAPNGNWIAVSGCDQALYQFDIRDSKRGLLDRVDLIGDWYYASVLKITPDGKHLLGTDSQGFLFVWRVDGLAEVAKTHLVLENYSPRGPAAMDVWTENGQLFVLLGFIASNKLSVWQVPTGGPDPERESNRRRTPTISSTATIRPLPAGYKAEVPEHFQPRNPGEIVQEFKLPGGQTKTHEEGIKAVVRSPDGRLVLSASGTFLFYAGMLCSDKVDVNKGAALKAERADMGRGAIRLWDMATGNMVAEYGVGGPAVFDAKFTPDGKYIISAHKDCCMRVWAVPTVEQIAATVEQMTPVRRETPEEPGGIVIAEHPEPVLSRPAPIIRR